MIAMTDLMRLKPLAALAGLAALGMNLGAWVFQYGFGMPPCAMCLWQRYPHWVAFALALLVLALRGPVTTLHRLLCWLGAAASATTGAIGIYHTGVERGWWEGPTSCTGTGELDLSNPLSIDGPAMVMCDVPAGYFFGLTMPTYNAIFSLVFAALWIVAATRKS